jgi:hypothetical protein
MINANNPNPTPLVSINKKSSSSVMESSLSKKKNKAENSDISNTKLGNSDKSTNKSLSTSDVKGDNQIKKETLKSPNRLTVNKKVALSESNKKNRVKFKKNFVDMVVVESYKKYNMDMSYNDAEPNESTKCRCLIF